MSICKKKGSPYLYTRFTLCGIRIDESTKTNSRRDAQEYEEKRKQEIRQHVLMGKKPNRTWPEAELKWLEEMRHKRSIYDDTLHFEWLQNYLSHYQLKDISKDVVENIAKEKEKAGVKPATVNRMLALIRSVLNRACKQWEWIDKVPVFRMRKEENMRVRWITYEESNRLIAELPKHLKPIVRFSLATGLRQSNVLNLKWSEVNMVDSHAFVKHNESKSKKAIPVPLNEDAMQILREQMGKHSEYVFVYHGKPIGQCNTKAWRKALKEAKIYDFRWHDLRHTWASWHMQNGTPLQELQQLGGWATLNMVLRYAHLSSHQLKAAAENISGAKLVKSSLKVVGENG